jgi:heme exporter protein D
MRGHARHRWTAAGVTLLPFLGVWLGHTAEYVRIHGAVGIRAELTGSVHGYMLPAGILLSLLAAAAGLRCAQAWWELGLRLRAARDAVTRAWRGRTAALPPAPSPPPLGEGLRFAALLLGLAPLQLMLYVLQENLEAWRAGLAAPGLGAIAGVHRAAPLVHLAVAACLASVVLLLQHALRRRGRAVIACHRLARVLLAALLRAQPAPRPRPSRAGSPRDRWGLHLLRRPPPATLPAS